MTTNASVGPTPTEIRVQKDKAGLIISFDDGSRYTLSAEYLRVESPSAEVKGHGTNTAVTVPGKRAVTISNVEPEL